MNKLKYATITMSLAAIVISCTTFVTGDNPTQHAPEPIKMNAFTSVPVQLDGGLVLCEDGSIWILGKLSKDGPYVKVLMVPPMEKSND